MIKKNLNPVYLDACLVAKVEQKRYAVFSDYFAPNSFADFFSIILSLVILILIILSGILLHVLR